MKKLIEETYHKKIKKFRLTIIETFITKIIKEN